MYIQSSHGQGVPVIGVGECVQAVQGDVRGWRRSPPRTRTQIASTPWKTHLRNHFWPVESFRHWLHTKRTITYKALPDLCANVFILGKSPKAVSLLFLLQKKSFRTCAK